MKRLRAFSPLAVAVALLLAGWVQETRLNNPEVEGIVKRTPG